jgi:hypothetical protein
MAIDPGLLAALTSGATASAKTSSATGIDWGAAKKNQPGAWSLGQGIIDVLSTGGYYTAGIAKKVGENVTAAQRGELGGLLDLLNPASAISSGVKGIADRRTYSENLRNWGVDDNTSTWLGLALDIGLDPATYLTGGAVAGVRGVGAGARLATAANKANATVVKSAAEAAVNNLPDMARAFIPSEVPLTQGQKMGNYLTGVLRGYDFNKSKYAAERLNSKLASKIQKEANKAAKAGDNSLIDFAEEMVYGLETAAKTTNASIADNVAQVNREALFNAIAASPVLQAKFGKRAEKFARAAAKAEDLKFVDPKTAKKLNIENASAAAKTSQLEDASAIDPTPATVKDEAVTPVRSEAAERVEAEIVAKNRTDAEELAAAIRAKDKTEKSYKRSLAAVRTKYGEISKEVMDFIGKATDPATGRRLSETLRDSADPLEDLARLLSEGKITPTANRIARFARVLGGVSSDPQQSVVDLMAKTLVSMSKAVNKLNKTEDELIELGNQLARGIESKFITAKARSIPAATGAADAEKAGEIAEKTMDLEGEIPKIIENAVGEAFGVNPGSPAKTAEQLVLDALSLRALPAGQLSADLAFISEGAGTSTAANLKIVLQDFLGSGPYDQLAKLADKRGTTVEDEVFRILESTENAASEPITELTKNLVRLDLINPEARISTYDKVWLRLRKVEGKGGRTPAKMSEEQGRILRTFENFWRLFGVPVKTQENILMQLQRDGQKMVGDKLSSNFVPMSMDFTTSDLAIMASEKGAGDIIGALQWPGKAYQNVQPTNFEYAALTALRYKQLGKEITPGSEAWLEIRKAFDQTYEFGEVEGLVPKKTAVEDFFVPAPHVNPNRKVGKVKLKKIPNLEQKTEAMIQFIADNLDEIGSVSAGRAASRVADAEAALLPQASEIMADFVTFVSVRDKFVRTMAELATTPRVAGQTDIPFMAGVNEMVGLRQVKTSLKQLIKSVTVGAKVFPDPKTAEAALDTIMNMFMKPLAGGTQADPLKSLDIASANKVRAQISREMSSLRKEIAEEISLFDALGSAKPSAKVTPKAAEKAKNARRQKAIIEAEETTSVMKQGLNNKDDVAEQMIKAGVKSTDERSSFPHNHAEATPDPISTGQANAAVVEIKRLTDPKFAEKWMIAFSGRQGMGLDLKVVIGGIEFANHSKVGYFKNTLRRMFVKYGKDTLAINNSFKLVQKWGKEMAARVEADQVEVPFREWVKTADTGGVNVEIAESFSDGIAAMFGMGDEAGVLSESMQHNIFADELNKMFDMRGFFELGEGAFRLPDDAGPMAIKYSWAAADVDNKFTSLTFLANYASALHAVKTRIGIGQSFSRFFGKTFSEIKEEGLAVENFVKIDKKDEFAKYLDPDKLYDASELKRLQAVKDFVLYPKSFSSKNVQKVVDFSDMITSVLKGAHTTWRLGHHITSIIGEAFMNSFAGVNSAKYYANSFKILRGFDASVYKGDPDMFKAYAEVGTPSGKQLDQKKFGEVAYINATTGKRTIVADEDIAFMAEQLGVLTRGGASTVEDLDLRGMGQLGDGLVGGVSRFNGTLAEFSSHRDNIFRMAHFVKEIEKGGVYKTFEEAAIAAAKQVTTYHPTVGGLSAFERKYMRRAVFFYTWQRIAATKVFQLIMEQPGKITIPSKIQYAFAESNGFNPESFGDPWDPDGIYASWHTGSTFGPQFQGPGGEGDAWGFSPAVPQLDIINQLLGGYDVQPGQSGFDVLIEGTQNLAGGNLSPLPKWFAELSTGNKVGTGGNINNYLEYAIDQVGGINTLSKLTGIGQDPETGLTPTEQSERKTRLLINWFLGQRLQDYSTSQTLRQYGNDQRLQMQRLLGDTGR